MHLRSHRFILGLHRTTASATLICCCVNNPIYTSTTRAMTALVGGSTTDVSAERGLVAWAGYDMATHMTSEPVTHGSPPEHMKPEPLELAEPPNGQSIGIQSVLSKPFKAHGIYGQILSVPGISANKPVVASICQVDNQDRPFMGNATMHVSNVVPYDGGQIEIWGHIQYNVDIRCRLAIVF
ncbi:MULTISPECIES: hypothetical protein [unclassified Streptomyces]|uniref:hypothetical protein n=1 Tax=unclassified Streptomyces TaxID=2593676 RepID=UPI00332F16B8